MLSLYTICNIANYEVHLSFREWPNTSTTNWKNRLSINKIVIDWHLFYCVLALGTFTSSIIPFVCVIFFNVLRTFGTIWFSLCFLTIWNLSSCLLIYSDAAKLHPHLPIAWNLPSKWWWISSVMRQYSFFIQSVKWMIPKFGYIEIVYLYDNLSIA